MYLPIEEFDDYIGTVDGSELDFEMNGIVLRLGEIRLLDGRAIIYCDRNGAQTLNGLTSSPMALHLSNPYQLRRPGEAIEIVTQITITKPLPDHVEGWVSLLSDMLRCGILPTIYPVPIRFSGLIRFPATPTVRAVLERGVDIGLLRFRDTGAMSRAEVSDTPMPKKRKGAKSEANTSGSDITTEVGE